MCNGCAMNFALSDLGKIRKEFVFLGKDMVRPGGFELPTFWFVARRSIQLSYGRTEFNYFSTAPLRASRLPALGSRHYSLARLLHCRKRFAQHLPACALEGRVFSEIMRLAPVTMIRIESGILRLQSRLRPCRSKESESSQRLFNLVRRDGRSSCRGLLRRARGAARETEW